MNPDPFLLINPKLISLSNEYNIFLLLIGGELNLLSHIASAESLFLFLPCDEGYPALLVFPLVSICIDKADIGNTKTTFVRSFCLRKKPLSLATKK